jgi:hypothetical protein
MEKSEIEKQPKEKPSTSNVVLPACGEVFKTSAIHGAVMGNVSGYKEGVILYSNEHGHNIYILTQLITYSRNILRIYNVEMATIPQKNMERKTEGISLVLINEFSLFGEIKGVNLISNPLDTDKKLILVYLNNHRVYIDYIYLILKLATLSLDSTTNTLSTVDLHNFENPDTGISIIKVVHQLRDIEKRSNRIL